MGYQMMKKMKGGIGVSGESPANIHYFLQLTFFRM
jgi:hypothetical protein